MNWKTVVALIGVALVGVAAWQTHRYLDARAIAVYSTQGWQIQSEGWAMLWQLWPAALLPALVIGLLGTALFVRVYGHAALADESERVKEYQMAAQQAERERDQAFKSEQQAQEIARRNVARERAAVEQFRQQLLSEHQKFQAWEARLQEREALAAAEVERAQANEARAERQKRNASAAYQRKKQKLEQQKTPLRG
jgi:hypothetical protein